MAISGSPSAFIKEEPDDFNFSPGRFMGTNFDHSTDFGSGASDPVNVNPSDLVNSNYVHGAFAPQNMSSSFMIGNSNIADDELLELCNFEEQKAQAIAFSPNLSNFKTHTDGASSHGYFNSALQHGGIPMEFPGPIFSPTPEGTSAPSPFPQDANYPPYTSTQALHHEFAQSLPTSVMRNGRNRGRAHPLERHGSDSNSPLTPKILGGNAIHLGAMDAGAKYHQHQGIAAGSLGHRHRKSLSGQWDNTPGSSNSWVESPLSSPQTKSAHPQITEVLTNGKHASVPSNTEGGFPAASVPALQTQEAKRRRRRESHNMVERRRRDNINDRIHDLSRLVPPHRLEDEKVRKHLQNNGPMSPSSLPNGISPPQAASLLAGANGRRPAASLPQNFALDDKDRGPNKGDILNGAVGWTRDLMWMLYLKFQQEEELIGVIRELNGQYPYDQTEEEQRMRSELIDAVERNSPPSFHYSRGPGSGLRVPKFTNFAGDARTTSASPDDLDPNFQGANGISNAVGDNQPQFWTSPPLDSSDQSRAFHVKGEEEGVYMMES